MSELCIYSTFCRNMNLYNHIHYVEHLQNLFLSFPFNRSRALDLYMPCMYMVNVHGKILVFLHPCWLWEGTTTWNYSLSVSLFCIGFFCPGQVLEILSVLVVMSQWQPHAIIVNSNINTVLACFFFMGFVFLSRHSSQGIYGASESAISCLETKHAGYCRLAE